MLPINVLIIDDSWAPAEGLKRLIEVMRPGANVRLANGAQQAREVLRSFRPDLVLLDVFLGGGLELGGSDEIAQADELQNVPTFRMSADPYQARERLTDRTTRNGLHDKLELPNKLGGILDEIEDGRGRSAGANTA